MRKYLLYILIISFVCTLASILNAASVVEKVIETYEQAVKRNPDDAKAHFNLGVTYETFGKYKEAIEAYKQAISCDSDHAAAHCNLGTAYSVLGKYKEAIDSLKQAIMINPDFAKAHFNLGYTYILLNDDASALKQHLILKPLDSELANKLFNLIISSKGVE